MDKRIKILRILVILIVISIALLLVFVYINKNNKDSNEDKNYNDFSEYEYIKKWYYVTSEYYDENGKLMDKPFELEDFYLYFHTDTVDVCYDECYTTSYIKHDNILTIGSFDYFSGTFEVSYEYNTMVLKSVYDGKVRIVYYFGKPINEEEYY